VRKNNTVPGSAGSSHSPTAWHQSVNSAQSPAYARTVRGDNACGEQSLAVDTSEIQAGDGVAQPRPFWHPRVGRPSPS
jgi:hypothetical protein